MALSQRSAEPLGAAVEPRFGDRPFGRDLADALATLEFPGRRTGRLISLPVVITDYAGERYLVAMLGKRTNWVRNARQAGGRARLRHGRREAELLEDVDPADRPPILRRYLECAPGARPHLPVDRHAPLEEFEQVAPEIPVVALSGVDSGSSLSEPTRHARLAYSESTVFRPL